MKRVFPLLASVQLATQLVSPSAFGQATVVSCEGEDHGAGGEILAIGIIPVEDYQKAITEVARLKRELGVALKRQAAAEKAGLSAAKQKKEIEGLRRQLKATLEKQKAVSNKEQTDFQQQEEAMVEKVNAMEKERLKATQLFQKQIASLQTDFGRKQGAWEKKLMFVEDQRDGAIRELDELKVTRMRDHKAWEKSVAKWQKEVEETVRKAQVEAAQKAVANTARLATDWKLERETLEAQVAKLEQKREVDKAAWEQSVADWKKKADETLRTTRMREAQEAVANTARLAAGWQAERDELENQVQEMSGQLAQLEGKLGVQGFEKDQADVLRLGMMQKSKALVSLGADADRLAREWKKEREESRRELEAMRDLYKSTAGDVSARDQRLKQVNLSLTQRDNSLNQLADEANKLAKTWQVQRGGLQKRIDALEKQLSTCEKKLAEALKKEKLAAKSAADPTASAKLKEQLALATDLKKQLSTAQKSEDTLRNGLLGLKTELGKLKEGMSSYKVQKEKDAEALTTLKAEFESLRESFLACEGDLKEARLALKKSLAENKDLKAESQKMAGQLDSAQKELKEARKHVEAGQKAGKEAAAKAARVKNLEGQLGKLSVAQQELEGTLISTLGDFEKLQQSYLKLEAESAGGGEAARKAIAERKVAEAKLKELQKKLQGEEAKLKSAEVQVQDLEKKRKAAESDAKAGKAALGKCEAELKKSRSELGKLVAGQEALTKEANALRERFVSIEPVRYQLASANVVAQQQRVLAEVKQVMEVYPNANFSIEGHTCNIGKEESNLKLSEERALGLRDFLIANGIGEDRFPSVEGRGDTQPQTSNDTDEGRRQNRRVEIEVVR